MTLTRSYVGTETVGASSLAMDVNRKYLKQVTVPALTVLASVDAYLTWPASTALADVVGAVLDDNAGDPGKVIGMEKGEAIEALYTATVSGWYSFPIARYFASETTVWIGIGGRSSSTSPNLAYETTGGSDKYLIHTNNPTVDGDRATSINDTTHDYSIRATLLT